MIWRQLFGGRERPTARFTEGRVAFAVGDIHGRADLLKILLHTLEREVAEAPRTGGVPLVVFLGDYVDRGTASAGVIDLLLQQRPSDCERRFLLGNHEQAMLAFLDAPLANRAWLAFGGVETLASYGIDPPAPRSADVDLEAAAAELRAKLPPAHLEFLQSLELYVEESGYAFVHAGVDPARSLAKQNSQDLLWIRDRFLSSRRRFSHRVVHGHTPTALPHADARRIGVDTGAYATGILTAARIEGDEVRFLNATAARF